MILLGLLLSLLLLELGLHVAGFTYLYLQEQGNKRSLNKKDTYKILCLGESTTQGQYPRYLEEELNNRNPGIKFSVIDKGRGAINTNYILVNLNKYLDTYKPDMVTTMMGVNDARSDVVADEYEPAGSYYKKLKTYKLMRLINLHAKSTIGKLKNDIGRLAGKSHASIGEAAKVLGNNPSYLEKGHYYRDRKEYKKAEAMYKKALTAGLADEQACLGLAELYKNTGRHEKAGKMYNKAIEINPKNEWGYINLGDCYMEQGRSNDAEVLYRKAIEINPKNESAYTSLGDRYVKQQNYEEAREQYIKAIEINQKNADVYIRLGDCYRFGLQKRYKEAEKMFRKVIELNPKQEKAYYRLSKLYELQNRYEEAAKVLKEGMKQENENDMGSSEDKDIGIKYRKINENTRSIYFGPGTIYNYKRLRKILKDKNITYVCVQYPVREAADLKGIFESDKSIIFVDNEKTFKDGVGKESYDEYFVDKMTKEFGHCTVKGNRLLAGNIAGTITKEVFNK